MVAKTSILKELETIYEKSGIQRYVLYGRTDSEKEQLLKAFLSNKKYYNYNFHVRIEIYKGEYTKINRNVTNLFI